MSHPVPPLAWLNPGDSFPPSENAWDQSTDAPGLLAAGGDLSVQSLSRAYRRGIFPWFSEGQPILWWSTDPRMVLRTEEFRLHRSLKKTIQKFLQNPEYELRMDSAFRQAIEACSASARSGQSGTWIVPEMVNAYCELHRSGLAHSVEVWVRGELVGGLYCVTLGQAVFGESMFSKMSDASKIALAALVAFCRANKMPFVDCQQATSHLAFMGAQEMPRKDFLELVAHQAALTPPLWSFDPLYWKYVLNP